MAPWNDGNSGIAARLDDINDVLSNRHWYEKPIGLIIIAALSGAIGGVAAILIAYHWFDIGKIAE